MKKTFYVLILSGLFCLGRFEPDPGEPITCGDGPPFQFRPNVYNIKLGLDYKDKSFTGEVTISGRVIEKTHFIHLHSAVDVLNVSLTLRGKEIGLEDSSENETSKTLSLEFSEELSPENNYDLWLEFAGEIRSMRGVFGSSYTVNGIEKYFIATELQSDYARHVFPCVDDPSYKAHFILNISRPENYTAISNMPLVSTSPDESSNGQVWDKFEITPLMSTYTLVFVVGDFERVESANRNSIWILRGLSEEAKYAARLAPRFVEVMENLTGIPFLLPKLDHIGLPKHNSGAMENWGAITYKESMLLIDEEISSIQKKLATTFSLAHEIAHQWIGNLVTCESWLFTWLNEGITSYFHFVITSKLFPSWDTKGLLLSEEALSILEEDGYTSTALTKKGCDIEETATFSMSTYYKGAALMRMVDYLITEENLINNLKIYLYENSFKTVNEDDLWIHMEDDAKDMGILPAGVNFTTIMKTWTNNNGFPLLSVTRNDDGTVTVCQDKFEYFSSNTTDGEKWWIPLTYTTSKQMNFSDYRIKGWLSPADNCTTVDIKLEDDEWIIFNIKQAGFYRVHYDESNWDLIIDTLKTNLDSIHPINRAQLLDNVFSLAKYHKGLYETALSLSTYLKEETEYYPWSAAIVRFQELYSFFNLGFSDNTLHYLKKYLLTLIEKVYRQLPTENDTYDDNSEPISRLLKSKIIGFACLLQHPDCEKRAIETMQLILSGNQNDLRRIRDIKIPLMCTMMRLGGEDIFNYAVEELKYEKRGEIYNKILSTIFCTKEKIILKQFIKNVFNDPNYIENTEIIELINVANKEDYTTIVEALEEIVNNNASKVNEMSSALRHLTEINFLPPATKKKIKNLVETYKDQMEDLEQILTNLEQVGRPWTLTKRIKDWLAKEVGSANFIEGRSLDSFSDMYDMGEMDLYNNWMDKKSHSSQSGKQKDEKRNEENKNASSSLAPFFLMTSVSFCIYLIII